MVKRNKKGFLFTVGDEPVLSRYSSRSLSDLFGHEARDTTSSAMLEEAQQSYHVYHFHVAHAGYGNPRYVSNVRSSFGSLPEENFITVDDINDIPAMIAKIVAGVEGVDPVGDYNDTVAPEANTSSLEEIF